MRITGDVTEPVQKIDLMGRLAQQHIADPMEYEEVRSGTAHQVNSVGLTPGN